MNGRIRHPKLTKDVYDKQNLSIALEVFDHAACVMESIQSGRAWDRGRRRWYSFYRQPIGQGAFLEVRAPTEAELLAQVYNIPDRVTFPPLSEHGQLVREMGRSVALAANGAFDALVTRNETPPNKDEAIATKARVGVTLNGLLEGARRRWEAWGNKALERLIHSRKPEDGEQRTDLTAANQAKYAETTVGTPQARDNQSLPSIFGAAPEDTFALRQLPPEGTKARVARGGWAAGNTEAEGASLEDNDHLPLGAEGLVEHTGSQHSEELTPGQRKRGRSPMGPRRHLKQTYCDSLLPPLASFRQDQSSYRATTWDGPDALPRQERRISYSSESSRSATTRSVGTGRSVRRPTITLGKELQRGLRVGSRGSSVSSQGSGRTMRRRGSQPAVGEYDPTDAILTQ